MRGRMDADKVASPALRGGEGDARRGMGVVVESRADDLQPDHIVVHDLGWREVAIDRLVPSGRVEARDVPPLPVTSADASSWAC